MSLTNALLALAAAGSIGSLSDLGPEPDAQRMSPAEIKANNATLTRDHPYYIRCQTRDETGSIAKKIRSCRTNRQWRLAFNQGNQNARDTYDAMVGKASSTSN